MRASSEFAGFKGRRSTYGYLANYLDPWTPPVEPGTSRREAIRRLADTDRYGTSPENAKIPAAYTFFGQFVTHDVTFDTRFDPRAGGGVHRNLRTPALDLDSVYGRGPLAQPYLYELDNPSRFCVSRNEVGELDLPRNNDRSVAHASAGDPASRRRSALIGDPRNDENVPVSQLHLAFLRFHNACIDRGASFDEARRLTTWHYQWVLVHDYLNKLCGSDVDKKLREPSSMRLRKLSTQRLPLLPFEFTFAAFRFGHSTVCQEYHLSRKLTELLGAAIPMFENVGTGWRDRDRVAASTLEGERALPRDWTVQWDRFVDVADTVEGAGPTQWSRRIDSTLAPSLQYLPMEGVRERSLAFLTLWHGYQQKLPAGQTLANMVGVKEILPGTDPLWLYILKEAAELERGERLGPLGATLVGEVLISLLLRDERSFARGTDQADWRPTLDARRGDKETFDLADFLIHAGVPITPAQWVDQRDS
jgi:heme peroxidase